VGRVPEPPEPGEEDFPDGRDPLEEEPLF